jgi:hypothetical protein
MPTARGILLDAYGDLTVRLAATGMFRGLGLSVRAILLIARGRSRRRVGRSRYRTNLLPLMKVKQSPRWHILAFWNRWTNDRIDKISQE